MGCRLQFEIWHIHWVLSVFRSHTGFARKQILPLWNLWSKDSFSFAPEKKYIILNYFMFLTKYLLCFHVRQSYVVENSLISKATSIYMLWELLFLFSLPPQKGQGICNYLITFKAEVHSYSEIGNCQVMLNRSRSPEWNYFSRMTWVQ